MVQEYQSPIRVYKHPFELVMAVSDFDLGTNICLSYSTSFLFDL